MIAKQYAEDYIRTKPDLFDDSCSRFQVLVSSQFGTGHDRGKGGLVLLLVGQGQGTHGAAMEAGSEAHNLTSSCGLGIIGIDARCMTQTCFMRPWLEINRK